jgi:hypothetical protein
MYRSATALTKEWPQARKAGTRTTLHAAFARTECGAAWYVKDLSKRAQNSHGPLRIAPGENSHGPLRIAAGENSHGPLRIAAGENSHGPLRMAGVVNVRGLLPALQLVTMMLG